MAKKYILIFTCLIGITIVLAWTLTNVRSVHSGPQQSTPTPSGLVTAGPSTPVYIPSLPKMTDLAPKAAPADKATIIIRHADGHREGFLLTTDMIDGFLNRLPAGDKVDNIIPPQSLVGHEPPEVTPAAGNQTYSGTPGTVIGTPPSGP